MGETVFGRWLKVERAAQYAGISRATMERMLADGRLQRTRVPGCRSIVIDRLAIDKLLEAAAEKVAG